MSDRTLQFDHPQDEQVALLGSQLREHREAQGLALETIAAQTKIQRRILQAIEAGDLSNLPEPVYTRGFIKQYADALGLDGREWVRDFRVEPVLPVPAGTPSRRRRRAAPQLRPLHLYFFYTILIVASVSGLSHMLSRSPAQTAAETGDRPEVASTGDVPISNRETGNEDPEPNENRAADATSESDAPEADDPEADDPETNPSETGDREADSPEADPPEAAAVEGDREADETDEGETTAEADDPEPATTEGDRDAAGGTAAGNRDANPDAGAESSLVARAFARNLEFPALQIEPQRPVQVDLTVTEQSWVRIVADGKTEFEGVLSEGTQRVWMADRELVVRAGNAGGVRVAYNNGEAKPLGPAGAVEQVTFTADAS